MKSAIPDKLLVASNGAPVPAGRLAKYLARLRGFIEVAQQPHAYSPRERRTQQAAQLVSSLLRHFGDPGFARYGAETQAVFRQQQAERAFGPLIDLQTGQFNEDRLRQLHGRGASQRSITVSKEFDPDTGRPAYTVSRGQTSWMLRVPFDNEKALARGLGSTDSANALRITVSTTLRDGRQRLDADMWLDSSFAFDPIHSPLQPDPEQSGRGVLPGEGNMRPEDVCEIFEAQITSQLPWDVRNNPS